MFSDIPESVLIICVADYSQSILPFYGTVVEHIEYLMTSNTELCHIIMKWNVSILLGTYRQYSSQIVNQSGKGYGHSLSRSSLQNIYFCNGDSADKTVAMQLGKKNYAQEQHSENAFYFGPNYRTSNILKQKSSTTPTPNPHPPKIFWFFQSIRA